MVVVKAFSSEAFVAITLVIGIILAASLDKRHDKSLEG